VAQTNATSRVQWQNATRQKLQASAVLNRLLEHTLADEDVMSASQVNAARVLLNKVLPDLKAVEVSTGEGGLSITLEKDTKSL
jgi:hypothetical protein